MTAKAENDSRAQFGLNAIHTTLLLGKSLGQNGAVVLLLQYLMHATRKHYPTLSFHDAVQLASERFAKDLEAEFSESPPWPFPAVRKDGDP